MLLTLGAAEHSFVVAPEGWGLLAGGHVELSSREGSGRLTIGGAILWDPDASFDYPGSPEAAVLMLLPEAGGSVHGPSWFPAYLGTGLGYSLPMSPAEEDGTWFVHFETGLELPIGGGRIIRPEARIRAMELLGWDGIVTSFTVGLLRR